MKQEKKVVEQTPFEKKLRDEIFDKCLFLINDQQERKKLYQSYLENSTIQNCIDTKSGLPLEETFKECIDNTIRFVIQGHIQMARNYLLRQKEYGCSDSLISNWFEDNSNQEFLIENLLSDQRYHPKECILAKEIAGFVTLSASKYENGIEFSYTYSGYLKKIIDTLNLNPAIFKEVHKNNASILIEDNFPDFPERNGMEAVCYWEFSNQIIRRRKACEFSFLSYFPIKTFYNHNFQPSHQIIIPKEALCGFFNLFNYNRHVGIEILKEIKIPCRKDSDWEDVLLSVDQFNDYLPLLKSKRIEDRFRLIYHNFSPVKTIQ